MSGPVIIRLQNLPLEARSIDIRKFFEGCVIPDGGVHIIGGEKGDAFIAFQSDEDARLAMTRDGTFLCNTRIKLFLSSKTEMQNVISAARNQLPASASSSLLTAVSSLNTTTTSNNTQLNVSPKSNTTPSAVAATVAPASTSSSTPSLPIDLLSSLTKLISSNNTNSKPSPPSATQQAPTAASTNSSSSSNLNIHQILEIIQNHIPANNNTNNESKNEDNQQQQQQQQQQSKISQQQQDFKNKPNFNNNNNNNRPNRYNNTSNPKLGNNMNNNSSNNMNNNNNNINNNSTFNKYQNKRKFDDNSSMDNSDNNNESRPFNKGFNNHNNSINNNINSGPRPILDPIIKVKNFNSNCSYKDIRTFLQGIQIEHDGIKLLTDSNTGQRNGMAFVKLMSITDLKKALCRNGQFYEDRIIQVLQSNETEFQNTDSVPPFGFNNNMGKPQRQFSNNNNNNGSNMNNRYNNNNSHNNNNNSNNSPMNNNNGKRFQSSPGSQSQQQGNFMANDMTNVGFFIKIYGLPAKFDENQLRSMFNNVKFLRIVTSKPTPITSTTTNPNGQQEQTVIIKAKKLCQVETQLDLERALTRQDEKVGKSKLQIFQISKGEFERELGNIGLKISDVKILSENSNSPNERQDGSNQDNQDDDYENDNNQQETNFDDDDDNNDNNMDDENIENNDDNEDNDDFNQEHSNDLYIYMSGVPFSAREIDVKQFFQGLNATNINILYDLDTLKPTGECSCQFGTRQDRDSAIEKDGFLLRNRVVKIKPLTYAEYQQYMTTISQVKKKLQQRRQMPLMGNNNNTTDNNSGNHRTVLLQTPSSPGDRPKLFEQKNFNKSQDDDNEQEDDDQEYDNSNNYNPNPKKNFYNNNNNNSNNSSNNNNNNSGNDVDNRRFNNNRNNNNNNNKFSSFPMRNNASNQQFQNNNNNGNNNPLKRRASNTNPGSMSSLNSGFNNNNNNSSNNNNNNNNNNNFKRVKQFNSNQPNQRNFNNNNNNNVVPLSLVDLPPLPPELQKHRNSLVLLSNVSFDASREDILELFRLFSPIEQTLKIRHDDRGQPTGDAIVALKSPEDATRACRSLNSCEFMGRYIKVSLVTP